MPAAQAARARVARARAPGRVPWEPAARRAPAAHGRRAAVRLAAGSAPAWSRCRRFPRSTRRRPCSPTRRSRRTGGSAATAAIPSASRAMAGRANGRVLPELRHPVLLQPQAGARRAGRRAVRGARLPRARRPRLDLPGQGPQPRRPLGGAEGPAQHRRRRRDGGGRRRDGGSSPSSSTRTSSAIYNFVQHASRRDGETRRLHRDGVRGRQVAEADPRSTPASAAARCRSPTRSPTRLRSCPPSATCTTGASSTATSSRTTSSSPRSSSSSSTWAASGTSTATAPIYGTVGYQAPEIETEGPSPCSDLYTVGRTLAVLTFEFAGFQRKYQFTLPESEPLLTSAPVLRPAAAPRHPPRPWPQVPVGGRDGGTAHRRAARGALGRRRAAAAGVLRPVQPRAAGHRHRPGPGDRGR